MCNAKVIWITASNSLSSIDKGYFSIFKDVFVLLYIIRTKWQKMALPMLWSDTHADKSIDSLFVCLGILSIKETDSVTLWGWDLSAISQRREVRREGKQGRHKRQHYSPADLRYIPPWMEYWKTFHWGLDCFSSLITEPFVPGFLSGFVGTACKWDSRGSWALLLVFKSTPPNWTYTDFPVGFWPNCTDPTETMQQSRECGLDLDENSIVHSCCVKCCHGNHVSKSTTGGWATVC